MNKIFSAFLLSIGLAVTPVQINAVDIVKQAQQETGIKRRSSDEALQCMNTAAELQGYCSIVGKTTVTTEQMADYFRRSGRSYPEKTLKKGGAGSLETFCEIVAEEAKIEDIRAEVVFAQMMLETNWLQFPGTAEARQYNFGGLGATGEDGSGISFPNVRLGIRAQIQHLKAYSSIEGLRLECVDERYEYVVKGCSPYVEWLGQQENPQGRGWTSASNYGYDIAEMVRELQVM